MSRSRIENKLIFRLRLKFMINLLESSRGSGFIAVEH